MAKRQFREADGQNRAHKRLRVVHEAPTHEDIQNVRHLRQLLAFDQDVKRARHGLQSLKVFLDGFGADSAVDADRRELLKDYLESAQPRIASEDAVYLPDIMEMWAFASNVQNDAITSAVPAVLALLLQVISTSFDLVAHAKGIAQTLLQERQLKLISKNLSAPKGSGYIISPTLRLLREIVSLDGGGLARKVFRSRDFTLASFARNLEVRNPGEGVEDPSKPSVRTNAVRLLLACLRFLPADAKKDLLTQKEVVSHLTFLLKDDPAFLIIDMLDTLKKHVLLDDKVPREIKFRTFSTKTLDRLAGLYAYRHDGDVEGRPAVRDAVHAFLVHVCTAPGAGILYTGTGMYPKDLEEEAAQDVKESDEFAAERAGWMERYTSEIPVANFALDEFILKLRPWSNMKHSELLVAIFEAAPELVASYFLANQSFSFEPKLSMTWIGYAAFIFNTVQLPLPKYLGNRSGYRRVPPPTTVLLDNILPLPLKQKDLSRSLAHKSDLVSFFAVRILVLSLQKLARALEMHREAAESSNPLVWEAAARRLVDQFAQRVPDMKDVINCYKSIPEGSVLQREAASKLLLLYYEVTPQLALTANFDVSATLLEALGRLDKSRDDPQDQAMGLMELENLLGIAGYSPGMRWFARAEGLAASPFTALLKVHANGKELTRVGEVLGFVAAQNQLLQASTGLGLLTRVIQGLKRPNFEVLLPFIDNCANRCAASPLKYLGLMEEMAAAGLPDDEEPKLKPVSLLLVAMMEQLPFVVKSAPKEALGDLAKALSGFLGYAKAAGEDATVVALLAGKMNEALAETGAEVKPKYKGEVEQPKKGSSKIAIGTSKTTEEVDKELDASGLEALLDVSMDLDEEDNSALTKWSSKSVDDLLDGTHIPALMRLLWSEHASIRQEALTNILKMAARIRESSHEEKDQVWLLLTELAESSRASVIAGPVPSPIVAFAIHALDIVKNPLHCLYTKVNTHLTRGPVWAADKVPLAHDVLHGEPSEDDRYYTEVSWLLTYLVDALRTPGDVAIFRRGKWFEKILVLAGNPYLRATLTTKVLRVLYRATRIEGGSTTLVTRFGVFGWLEAREASRKDKEAAAVLAALRRRLWETCDQERVAAWSSGGIPRAMGVAWEPKEEKEKEKA
ncbi:ribosome 60S biogenesis N-terminal-domain-containing protein [Plectosphaerella plurivora]|uniref:Ribosome 60S biogenesis N-terminal-domain-containing protein n=1 Tax=Plectosphaerella plurivora TaxID=936078 RepID=A0A9P8V2Z1_9PEZI|nr:ribosome 60S biogenesis N-terminal-domain-containing protein [Plectosphaerella plurivora]